MSLAKELFTLMNLENEFFVIGSDGYVQKYSVGTFAGIGDKISDFSLFLLRFQIYGDIDDFKHNTIDFILKGDIDDKESMYRAMSNLMDFSDSFKNTVVYAYMSRETSAWARTLVEEIRGYKYYLKRKTSGQISVVGDEICYTKV